MRSTIGLLASALILLAGELSGAATAAEAQVAAQDLQKLRIPGKVSAAAEAVAAAIVVDGVYYVEQLRPF